VQIGGGIQDFMYEVKMQNKLEKTLLLATNNAGKLRELHQLLQLLSQVRLVSPRDLGIQLDVAETGTSYAENASLKACAFAREAGMVVIADDSGLEVDALNGAPGIRSARYAPQPGATDGDRRTYLLENLAGQPRPWSARFRAWVVVAAPGAELFRAEGVCEGQIIPQERGTNGFGYDPIFLIPSMGKTMAELTDVEKNALSHRGNAIRVALPMLFNLFASM